MTRIVHLTDLHFGRERADLAAPLAEAVRGVVPELVVVTGDLSHRARAAQFRAAMGFLRGLGLPLMVLPGNHDVPLFNIAARFLFPFAGWRAHVARDPVPVAMAGGVRVVAANTADPFSWRRGVLRPADLRPLAERGGALTLLACHHPLREPPGFARGETRGAAEALPALVRQGVDMVLSGHLHHWAIGLGIAPGRPQPLLIVQTGSALCGRAGEAEHGFSVLDLAPGRVGVTPWIVEEATGRFLPRPCLWFRRGEGGWHAAEAPCFGHGTD